MIRIQIILIISKIAIIIIRIIMMEVEGRDLVRPARLLLALEQAQDAKALYYITSNYIVL